MTTFGSVSSSWIHTSADSLTTSTVNMSLSFSLITRTRTATRHSRRRPNYQTLSPPPVRKLRSDRSPTMIPWLRKVKGKTTIRRIPAIARRTEMTEMKPRCEGRRPIKAPLQRLSLMAPPALLSEDKALLAATRPLQAYKMRLMVVVWLQDQRRKMPSLKQWLIKVKMKVCLAT